MIDVHCRNFKAVESTFKDINNDNKEELPPTPLAMVEHYFSDTLIESIVNSSNANAFERKRREPNLSVWKKKNITKEVTLSDILHFLAILFYVGIVQLPSKQDYWSTGFHWMPSHPICSVNEIFCERFGFLWKNFHCNHATNDYFEEDVQDELGDDEDGELQMERVQRD